jgi:hypothetical protein
VSKRLREGELERQVFNAMQVLPADELVAADQVVYPRAGLSE